MQDKISFATKELESKEKLIQKLEKEKRDCVMKYETMEFSNFELQQKYDELLKKQESQDDQISFGKHQNMSILE